MCGCGVLKQGEGRKKKGREKKKEKKKLYGKSKVTMGVYYDGGGCGIFFDFAQLRVFIG